METAQGNSAILSQGLKVKKILRLPFDDQLEKYSQQMQIFSCQFVYCKWCSL